MYLTIEYEDFKKYSKKMVKIESCIWRQGKKDKAAKKNQEYKGRSTLFRLEKLINLCNITQFRISCISHNQGKEIKWQNTI